jgi:hypothetical protein
MLGLYTGLLLGLAIVQNSNEHKMTCVPEGKGGIFHIAFTFPITVAKNHFPFNAANTNLPTRTILEYFVRPFHFII